MFGGSRAVPFLGLTVPILYRTFPSGQDPMNSEVSQLCATSWHTCADLCLADLAPLCATLPCRVGPWTSSSICSTWSLHPPGSPRGGKLGLAEGSARLLLYLGVTVLSRLTPSGWSWRVAAPGPGLGFAPPPPRPLWRHLGCRWGPSSQCGCCPQLKPTFLLRYSLHK